jgi:metallo-beta-lactamase family protein
MDTRASVKFLGGTADGDNPTGSCHLLTIEMEKRKNYFLIDSGLIQSSFKESSIKNLEILQMIKPSMIDGIILTHAHVDHSGRIPLLVKHGFNGRIYCSEQTANMLPIMLKDNAKIQLSEASYRTSKNKERVQSNYDDSSRRWGGNYDRKKNKLKMMRKKDSLCEPLYNLEHVEQTCALIKNNGYGYGEWIKLAKGVELKFYPSGHVLGGAICIIKIAKHEGFFYSGFIGDLGRPDGIILPPPEKVEEPVDDWLFESTYGGKIHPPREQENERLIGIVNRAVAEKRKIIIPSFALERTQEIIFLISKFIVQGKIPKIAIYLDSPMATKITEVFSAAWQSPGLFKEQNEINFNPFCPQQNTILKPIEGPTASSELIKLEGSHIVIAGSGMCHAGRIRGHLRAGLGSKKTTVCLIGYMVKGSLGRQLQEGYKMVRMNKEDILVNAEIEVFGSFSAHADSPGLVDYAESIKTERLKKIFLVHGELKSATDLKVELMKKLNMTKDQITIPGSGMEYDLQ